MCLMPPRLIFGLWIRAGVGDASEVIPVCLKLTCLVIWVRIMLEMELFFNRKQVPLCTVFHCNPSINLIWPKNCWHDSLIAGHPAIYLFYGSRLKLLQN